MEKGNFDISIVAFYYAFTFLKKRSDFSTVQFLFYIILIEVAFI